MVRILDFVKKLENKMTPTQKDAAPPADAIESFSQNPSFANLSTNFSTLANEENSDLFSSHNIKEEHKNAKKEGAKNKYKDIGVVAFDLQGKF